MDTQLKDFRTFITNLKESLTITKSHLEKISQKEPGKNLEEKGIDPNALRNFRREIKTFHDKISVLKQIISNPNQPIRITENPNEPIRITENLVIYKYRPKLPQNNILATYVPNRLKEGMSVKFVEEKPNADDFTNSDGFQWSDGWLDSYNQENNTWALHKWIGPGSTDYKYESNIPLNNIALEWRYEFPKRPFNHILGGYTHLLEGMSVKIVEENPNGNGFKWSDGVLDSYNQENKTWRVKKLIGPDSTDYKYESNILVDNIAVDRNNEWDSGHWSDNR